MHEEKRILMYMVLLIEIKSKIIGQNTNQRMIDTTTNNKDLIATHKAYILMDGPTGTGKTIIIKEVADKLSLPVEKLMPQIIRVLDMLVVV